MFVPLFLSSHLPLVSAFSSVISLKSLSAADKKAGNVSSHGGLRSACVAAGGLRSCEGNGPGEPGQSGGGGPPPGRARPFHTAVPQLLQHHQPQGRKRPPPLRGGRAGGGI